MITLFWYSEMGFRVQQLSEESRRTLREHSPLDDARRRGNNPVRLNSSAHSCHVTKTSRCFPKVPSSSLSGSPNERETRREYSTSVTSTARSSPLFTSERISSSGRDRWPGTTSDDRLSFNRVIRMEDRTMGCGEVFSGQTTHHRSCRY